MMPSGVLGAISDRQVAGLRLFLATSAMVAIYLDPSEPDRFVALTYTSLALYTLYSGAVYYFSRQVAGFSRPWNFALVWTDVAAYSLLISLSSGTNSIFYTFYFFAILVACSRLGPNAGVAVTLAALINFVTLAYLATPPETFELNRILLRAVSLFGFGYVLTYWARAEQRLRCKLELLREVSLASNPRFGIDRTADQIMKKVLEFFSTDLCIVLDYERDTEDVRVRRVQSAGIAAQLATFRLTDDVLPVFRGLLHRGSVLLVSRPASPWHHFRSWLMRGALPSAAAGSAESRIVADWLGCPSLMAVPLRHQEWITGYILVASRGEVVFRPEDAQFLLQVADQVTPVLEHIRLVDRMASEAAEEERHRIARSVHDRIIQPYIGLQMGLRGVRGLAQSFLEGRGVEALSSEGRRALDSLDHLVEMAREGVEELRQYIYGLQQGSARGGILFDSLLRYAAKFEAVTGIRVQVTNRLSGEKINDRLSAEIFQMVAEALSNVRRHTSASTALLTLEPGPAGTLGVQISNPAAFGDATFVPRSIAKRAESLGGRTLVANVAGQTTVRIEIPL